MSFFLAPSLHVNKNEGRPEERMNGACQSMNGQSGDLYTSVAGTHLPLCSRQQQAAAASVAVSVSYPQSVSSVVWLQTAYSRRQLTMNEGEWMW
jgi:hypothetical protein